jgi:hypothetical protein
VACIQVCSNVTLSVFQRHVGGSAPELISCGYVGARLNKNTYCFKVAPAGSPVQGRQARGAGYVEPGASREKEFDHPGVTPSCCTVQRRLTGGIDMVYISPMRYEATSLFDIARPTGLV